MVNKALETMKSQIDSKSINCSTDMSPKLMTVADSDKIFQVIINLLSNAIKFTSENGSIVLSGSIIDSEIKVSVTDNGIGIHPQDIDSIFDKFKQISTGIKRKTGGTGLGLAICKTIIELHDGAIGVESAVDKGSTFWFSLPCETE